MQTETTEEEDPKKMGRVLKPCRIRNGGEGTAGEGASLGLEQGLAGWEDGGLELIVVGCVNGDCCLLLPSSSSGCFFGVCF